MSEVVQAISMILALAGITCFRMFTPVFLYMVLLRYGGQLEFLASGVERLQTVSPAWMSNDVLFTIFGILAVLEIIANWNEDLREFFTGSEFEKYAKVLISALVSFGFLSMEGEGEQILQPLSVPQEAAILPLAVLGALTCGALTAFFVRLRNVVVECVRALDPGNDLHLQTLLAGAEESLAVFLLMLVILLPSLALVLTLLIAGLGKAGQLAMAQLEKRNCHPCASCGKAVSCVAEICPECGTHQEQVAEVGMFGLPRKTFLESGNAEQLHRQHQQLRLIHRCPHCATPLRRDEASCHQCHSQVWPDEEASKEFLHTLDQRALVVALVGLVLNGIPIIGFPCFLIAFSALVMAPLRAFLNPIHGCFGKMFFTFLKVLFTLVVVLFAAAIPFAGLLLYIPYGLYYLHCRNAFQSGLRKASATPIVP